MSTISLVTTGWTLDTQHIVITIWTQKNSGWYYNEDLVNLFSRKCSWSKENGYIYSSTNRITSGIASFGYGYGYPDVGDLTIGLFMRRGYWFDTNYLWSDRSVSSNTNTYTEYLAPVAEVDLTKCTIGADENSGDGWNQYTINVNQI